MKCENMSLCKNTHNTSFTNFFLCLMFSIILAGSCSQDYTASEGRVGGEISGREKTPFVHLILLRFYVTFIFLYKGSKVP